MKAVAQAVLTILLIVTVCRASDKEAKAKYDSLAKRVSSGDQSVDLNELRLAAGEAGIESDVKARDRLMTAARDHDYKKMADAAEAVLKSNYADLDAHYFAKVAAKALGKPEQEEFHRRIELSLLKSLRSSGDGQTPETAMKVISVDEEYFILRMMGQVPKEQSLGTCAGACCDIYTSKDQDSKQEHTWYFNVEIPMKRLSEALGEAKKPMPKDKK